jgi:hypothetical protein
MMYDIITRDLTTVSNVTITKNENEVLLKYIYHF